jgi:serine/threonine protein kinase
MGEVFLAEDSKLGRKVAIKMLSERWAGDPQARERLSNEARAAAALDHPNICSIYEVGEEDGRVFFVMQYIEGQTLC